MELTPISTAFWKIAHNLKEIVNVQVLFVLTVGYINMTTTPLRKYCYIIKGAYFIYRLFILFISTLSLFMFFYTVSWRCNRDYLHASLDVLFYIKFCVINSTKKHETLRLLYTIFVLSIHRRSRFEPTLPVPPPQIHYL